jgi:hypothetical protein
VQRSWAIVTIFERVLHVRPHIREYTGATAILMGGALSLLMAFIAQNNHV